MIIYKITKICTYFDCGTGINKQFKIVRYGLKCFAFYQQRHTSFGTANAVYSTTSDKKPYEVGN